MSEPLHEVLLSLLAVQEGTRLREKIVNTAGLLTAVEDEKYPASAVEVVDLWSSEAERRTLAERKLASLWIAAKFWGMSLQRVSLSTIVTDLLYRRGTSLHEEEELCGAGWGDVMEMVSRLHEAEMVLLRRQKFVVPGVCLGVS
uniref:Uncharacterized protein n=1 Tax=Trypanosoma congolense (strain IL3000) TaxID=1068625 RepID=G0V0S5_TRYCI|nr:hypothetical protein, unlikely [Trypanosoma congolense IL3000]